MLVSDRPLSPELVDISKLVLLSRFVSESGLKMAGVRSEDELGVKWDRCLADTGIKLLGGDH